MHPGPSSIAPESRAALPISCCRKIPHLGKVWSGARLHSPAVAAYIAFTKGDTRDIVHDYVGQRGEDAGIDVERRGKKPISI